MLFGGLGVTLGRLGLTWGTLVRSWGVLGRSWDVFGLSCGTLRLVWGPPGAVLGAPGERLGTTWPPLGRPRALRKSILNRFVAIGRAPEIIKKPWVFIGFCRLGALLGSPGDRLGAILVPSWRVLLPLWASVASLTPS